MPSPGSVRTVGQLSGLLALLLTGCSASPEPGPRRVRQDVLRPAAESPLFVHFPDLDHRIARVDRRSGQVSATYYLDRFAGRVSYLRDFAVSPEVLAALPGQDGPPGGQRLLVLHLEGAGRLKGWVPLPPSPRLLAWDCRGRLLVGHGPGPAGPPGRLTVVDPGTLRVVSTIPRSGAVISVASVGSRAYLVERTQRRASRPGQAGEERVITRFSLTEVDLERSAVVRQRDLPQGARQVVVGPSGELYISHVSGSGAMATDGTLSVLNPRTLGLARRLRLQMVVRGIAATRQYLLINMLSPAGESWVEVMDPDQGIVLNARPLSPVSSQMAAVGEVLYLPSARGSALCRFSLPRPSQLAELRLPRSCSYKDRPGLVRTWMECHAR